MQANKLSISNILEKYAAVVLRAPKLIITLFTLITIFGVNYTKNNLTVNTNTENMLSKKLGWRQTFSKYNELFPQYKDTILVVISGTTAEQVDIAAHTLQSKIQGNKMFSHIFFPNADKFFSTNGLLYLHKQQLQTLDSRIQQWSRLSRGMPVSVDNIINILENNIQKSHPKDEELLQILTDKFTSSLNVTINNKKDYWSWQEFFFNKEKSEQKPTRFIIIKPKLNYKKLFPAEMAISNLREAITATKFNQEKLEIHLTGPVPLAHEELISVNKGIVLAGSLSLLMVCVVLYICFRSIWLVLCSTITLITGLIATSAFTAFAIGHLNLISIAFAVLYIGLGIDFAIHICCHFQEQVQNTKRYNAIINTIKNTGTSLAFCALTTAIGFYAFLPTSFNGVSELGLISGTGMLISFIFNVTLLPALLAIVPKGIMFNHYGNKQSSFKKVITSYREYIIIVFLILFLVSVLFLPKTNFVADPMKLRDPNQESVITYNNLLQSSTPPTNVVSLTYDIKKSRELREKFDKLDTVAKTVTIDDFVPKNQQEKLAIINSMLHKFPFGMAKDAAPVDTEVIANKLSKLQYKLNEFMDKQSYLQLNNAISRWQKKLSTLDPEQQQNITENLQNNILYNLPLLLQKIKYFSQAKEITVSDLPSAIKSRWVADSGVTRMEIYPRENLIEPSAIHRFVSTVQTIDPNVTGLPVIYEEAGKAVVDAFQQALLYAFIGILVLLTILFRNIKNILLVLTPLVFASCTTGACSILLNIPFNFANIIALPLLLGIGVDNGIHLIHRQQQLKNKQSILHSSTTVAIIASTFTTICSFGNLAFSPHLGMASMGKLLGIGMLLTLAATVILLPAVISWLEEMSPKYS